MLTKLETMLAQINAELLHIPAEPRDKQGLLRALFQMSRMESLGQNATKKQAAYDVLQSCLAHLMRTKPNDEFLYDKEFFRPPQPMDIFKKYRG